MRALNVLLVLTLWLSPAIQAYARTLSQAHCRAQGHISVTAQNVAQDAMHAAHQGDRAVQESSVEMGHGGHDAAHAEQCKCDCLCGHAGVSSVAIPPGFLFADAPLPEHFGVVSEAALPHAEHPALQRPPAVLS